MAKNKYTEFYDVGKGMYEVWNIIYNQKVGIIKKARMGKWMHWQLFADDPDVGFSNGCLKEISKFITSLYSKDKKGKDAGKSKISGINSVEKEKTPAPPKEKEEK